MNPDERKMIEEWAKKAEFNANDKKAAIDLEMKLKMAKDRSEQKSVLVSYFPFLSKADEQVFTISSFSSLQLVHELQRIGPKQGNDDANNGRRTNDEMERNERQNKHGKTWFLGQ